MASKIIKGSVARGATGAVTAQVVATGLKAGLSAVTFHGAAANGQLILRDGGATGTILWRVSLEATDLLMSASLPIPIIFEDGIHATVSGTDPNFSISYIVY